MSLDAYLNVRPSDQQVAAERKKQDEQVIADRQKKEKHDALKAKCMMAVQKVFGFPDFRPNQLEIVMSIMQVSERYILILKRLAELLFL